MLSKLNQKQTILDYNNHLSYQVDSLLIDENVSFFSILPKKHIVCSYTCFFTQVMSVFLYRPLDAPRLQLGSRHDSMQQAKREESPLTLPNFFVIAYGSMNF